MTSDNFLTNSPRTHLYPPNKLDKCSGCEKPLKELYRTKPRPVRGFGGLKGIIEHVFVCKNSNCKRHVEKFYPERCTPPGSSFHFDVVIETGRLRRKEKKTFKEIVDILRDKGVKIGKSASCAKHVFNYYEIYELIWNEQDLNRRCQGQDAVISVDGVKPDKNGRVLYLANGHRNREVLASKWLLHSRKKDIAVFLEKLKVLDLNVVGAVSDKQRTILSGLQEVFGKIPHQYCQVHWFKNAFEPLSVLDRLLDKQVKAGAQKIRNMFKYMENRVDTGTIPANAIRPLKELESYLIVILQAKNKPPFFLSGLRNWKRAGAILTSTMELLAGLQQPVWLETARSYPETIKGLGKVSRVLLETLEDTLYKAWAAKTGLKWLKNLNKLLDPSESPAEWLDEKQPAGLARERVEGFLTAVDTRGDPFLMKLRLRIVDTLKKWKKGLFTCFDYTFLPRTNNDQEQFIYLLKKRQNKISGRTNNHSVLTRQQCFRYSLSFPLIRELLDCCKKTSIKRYREVYHGYLKQIEPLLREYRIKKNFERQLDLSFAKITEEVAMSSFCT